jgi:ubiquinone/menaquinone biosynthesis C-methylase UbiE
VDSSQSMLNKIDTCHGFNLSLNEIENLNGFEDNSFDVITARMVFHHANDPDKAMKEVNRVLKSGGKFVICEGNPPDRYSVKFYKEMFRFKEDRITFLLDDLVNLLVRQNFYDITSKTIIMKNMSFNNWLGNSGLPFRNIDIIKKMHYEGDSLVQKAYNMEFQNDDILMDWKFSIVSGVK